MEMAKKSCNVLGLVFCMFALRILKAYSNELLADIM